MKPYMIVQVNLIIIASSHMILCVHQQHVSLGMFCYIYIYVLCL